MATNSIEYMRAWRAKNPRTSAKYSAAYRRANREKVLAAGRAWYAANRQARAEHDRRKKYRLSPSQFAEMVSAQNGRCAICRKPTARFYIDHDHDTKALRELLCNKCNLALGLFGESAEVLLWAAAYLQKHRKENA